MVTGVLTLTKSSLTHDTMLEGYSDKSTLNPIQSYSPKAEDEEVKT